MAVIDGNNHFAAGWQEKKVSEKVADNIHQSGVEKSVQDKTQANQTMEKLINSKNVDASQTSASKALEKGKVSSFVEKQVTQSAAQASRPETSQESAKFHAQEQYQNLKGKAQGLDQLVKAGGSEVKTATPDAVVSKNQTAQSNLSPNMQQSSTFTLSQAANRVPHQNQKIQSETVSKSVDPKKLTPEDQTRARPGEEKLDAQKISQNGHAATPEGVKVATQTAQAGLTKGGDTAQGKITERDADSRQVSKEKKTTQPKTAGVHHHKGAHGAELEKLLGGGSAFSSDSEGENADAQAGSSVAHTHEVPSEDHSLKFYNEPNEGLETVLAKRNILEHDVIKSVVNQRVGQIAALNDRLNDTVVAPLSQRLINGSKSDLDRFMKNILQNVYGVLRG